MSESPSFSFQILEIILHSTQKRIRFARTLLIIAITLLSLQKLSIILSTFNIDWIYSKDMFVYYIVSAALHNKVNPYETINILANQFIYPNNLDAVSFVSPPPAILFISWMSFLPLKIAGWAWLIIQLICILGISILASNYFYSKNLSWKYILLGFVVLIGFPPFTEDLIYGNLSIILLFLLMTTWYFIKNNQEILAGIILGIAIAIKIYYWPFALFYIIKKKTKVSFSIGLTIILLNILAAICIGLDTVVNYYLKIPANSGANFLGDSLSLWSIGWRLFFGLGIRVNSGVYAPPLAYNPDLAILFSYLLPITFLVAMVMVLWHQENPDISFALLACGCLLISPIAWTYYFVLLLVPFIVIFENLKKQFFPDRQTMVLIIIIIFHYISFLKQIAIFLSGAPLIVNGMSKLSFAASMILILPTISVLILFVLLINISIKAKKSICK